MNLKLIKKLTLYTIVIAVIVTSLYLCQRLSNDISWEEYQVYSDYYNSLINEIDSLKIDKLVLVDSSSCRYKLNDDDIERIESEFEFSLPKPLIADFRNKNNRSYKFNRFFDLNINYILISKNELDSIFKNGWWGEFYEKYPNSQGRTYLSRVGFNKNRTEALFYMGTQSAGLAGIGLFIYLKKENGKWIPIVWKQMWIS
jgi:hypothetical protein